MSLLFNLINALANSQLPIKLLVIAASYNNVFIFPAPPLGYSKRSYHFSLSRYSDIVSPSSPKNHPPPPKGFTSFLKQIYRPCRYHHTPLPKYNLYPPLYYSLPDIISQPPASYNLSLTSSNPNIILAPSSPGATSPSSYLVHLSSIISPLSPHRRQLFYPEADTISSILTV